MYYVLERLRESSTWRGIVYLATAFGLKLTEVEIETLVAAGLALAGAISVFVPDKKQ